MVKKAYLKLLSLQVHFHHGGDGGNAVVGDVSGGEGGVIEYTSMPLNVKTEVVETTVAAYHPVISSHHTVEHVTHQELQAAVQVN